MEILPKPNSSPNYTHNHISHVLIFPLPAQGHITPMLHLSELLCLANIKVTFLITTDNHHLLNQHTNVNERFARYPSFRFETIPQARPNEHPKTLPQGAKAGVLNLIRMIVQGLESSVVPILRELLIGSKNVDKVTCFIIDGWLSFGYDIAHQANVPVFAFRCPSACCIWAYICIPHLIHAREVPFKDEEMDELVKNVPGMSSFLRYRDLPSFCRGQDNSSCIDLEQLFSGELHRNKNAYGFILNTFEDLEGPILTKIQSQYSKVYPIGPLHAHLKYRLGKENQALSNSSSSLWEVDQGCISWLDQKPNKSVVYVSFGSIATLTNDQLLEIWAGLVRSNYYFLWVIRPDVIFGDGLDSPTPDELLEGTKKRGCIVKWAPQDEVLAHRAVGGFLTHSGWNSTLESIVAGVPMICWPYFGDQPINSRFVSEIWKIGLDMKDTCDRVIVENMINDLMDRRKDELKESMDQISHLANRSISKGGSSYSYLDHLIEDIKALAMKREA